MYSLVLMMAATSAPEIPNWGICGHCCHTYASCYGCYGGCYGGGYAWGGPAYASYACSGCAGNVTSYHSCYGYAPNYYQPFSCFGYGVYGGASYSYPIPYDPNPTSGYGYGMPYPANTIPRLEKKDEMPKKEMKLETKKDDKMMIYPTASNKAQVVVRLPGEAKLFANNTLTNLTSSERQFSTPVLDQGVEYQYEMKIEYTRNGATVTDTQTVKVRAGQVSVVEFADRDNTEKAVSTIRFLTPAGAKLYVDNKVVNLSGNSTEYKTPELVKGAEYSYEVRAEIDVKGKKDTQSQRVVFKAGESTTVDFMDLGTIRTASK